MDDTDCYTFDNTVYFGEDVSLESQREHRELLNANPTAPVGFYRGAISGVSREGHWPSLSIVLPGGLLYVSEQPFEMVDGSFRVENHGGSVDRGGLVAVAEVVDAEAQATGSFTCGSVTRQ